MEVKEAFDEDIEINIKKEKVDVFEAQNGDDKPSQHRGDQVNGLTDIKIEVLDDVEMKDCADEDDVQQNEEHEIKKEQEEITEEEVKKENESNENNDKIDKDESNDIVESNEEEDEVNVSDSEKPEEISNDSESEAATADDDGDEEVLEVDDDEDDIEVDNSQDDEVEADEGNSQDDEEQVDEGTSKDVGVSEVDEGNSKDNEEEEAMGIPKVYYVSDIISDTSEEDRLVEGPQSCETCGKSFKSIEYFYIHQRLHLEGRLNKFPKEPKPQPKPGTSGASTNTQAADYGSESNSDDSDDSTSRLGLTHTVGPSSSNQFRSRLRDGRSDLLVEGPRVCKFCGKTFYSMDYYRIHQRVHVSEKLKHVPLQQTKQNKGPGGKTTVSAQDHQVISVYPQMGVLDVKQSPMNNQKIPFTKKCCQCDVCHLTFPNYRSLVLHKKVHRKGLCTVYPLYVCSVCNRGFVSKQSFLTHCDFHDAKPWTCNVCGMAFSKKLYLGMHKTSKHKQKRYDYKCDDCGKLFEKSKELQKHQKIHNPEKPEEQIKISCLCQVCGKMLPVLSTKDLRIHMGIHFGEILKCHICPEIFRETDEFKEHMDRHLGL